MKESIAAWSEALGRVAECAAAGELEPATACDALTRSPHGRTLGEVVRAAQDAGWPMVRSIRAFRKELRAAAQLGAQVAALKRLMVLRVLVMLIFVGIMRRVWALPEAEGALSVPDAAPLRSYDLKAILCGGLLLAGGSLIFWTFFPKSWVWHRGLTKDAGLWLWDHLQGGSGSGDKDGDGPWRERLSLLTRRELSLGVSLKVEKRDYLAAWAEEERERAKERLRLIEESLPLWDLAVLGLAAALFLLMPLLYHLRMGAQVAGVSAVIN